MHISLQEKELGQSIVLGIGRGKKASEIIVGLMNVKRNKKYQKFDSAYALDNIEGINFLPLGFKYKKNGKDMLGDFKDSYRDKTAIICRDINAKCEEVYSTNCSQCRYGYYEVLGRGCEIGNRKYCGVDHCGEKGQPACLRGETFIPKDKSDICKKNSMAGFCQKGLSAYCDGNNILICL